MIHNIPEYNFENLEAKVNRLSRKAVKLGLAPIVFEVLGSHLDKTKDDRAYLVYEVDIEGQSPIIEGWQFVGKAENIGEGNVVMGFEELPEKYRHTDMLLCEHCHTRRSRNAVYILKDEQGQYIQVGSTCLKDFGGHPDILGMARYAEELHKLLDGIVDDDTEVRGSMGGESYVKLEKFVAYTIKQVETHGFLSKSKAVWGQIPTANVVISIMFPHNGIADPVEKVYIEKAKVMINWIRTWDKGRKSDYEHNMMLICQEDYIRERHLGYVASLVPLFGRENEVKAQSGVFVGAIKQRLNFSRLECFKILAFDTQWGTTYLHKFNDTQGNLLVWFSSSVRLEEGQVYMGKGTVKDHKVYNGENQTVLTRCKLKLK